MRKIKKGDTVIILTGKSKNQVGVVKSIISNGTRALVENANIYKKHVKPNPNTGIEGGVEDITKSIDISNIAIFNDKTKKADRIGIRINDKGKKERYFKSDKRVVVV